MSRAGIKQKRKPAIERRSPTNVTLDHELRDWGVAHAGRLGLRKSSLSELITRLLIAEKAKTESLIEACGDAIDADVVPLALLKRAEKMKQSTGESAEAATRQTPRK